VSLRLDHVPAQEELAASDERVTGESAELGGAERARDREDGRAAAQDAGGTDRFVRLVIPHLDDAYTLARWMPGPIPELARSAPQPRRRRFRTTRRAGRRRAPSPR
jgi:hypothetical protein